MVVNFAWRLFAKVCFLVSNGGGGLLRGKNRVLGSWKPSDFSSAWVDLPLMLSDSAST